MPTNPIIGIDPGVHGAIAVVNTLVSPTLIDCPTVEIYVNKKPRTRCDPAGMAQVIEQVLALGGTPHAFLEQVNAHPDQGVASMFTFGQAYGMWFGVLAALKVPMTQVTPQAWKKTMMPGMGKVKDASRVRAVQLYPQVHGHLGPKHAGRADALLIAEYGRMQRCES